MPTSYVCSICGKEHQGLTTDWAYKLPDEVWAIPETERNAAARFSDDLCEFGDRYFIRCVLPTRFLEADGAFSWGVWAEVEPLVFRRYLELYDKDGSTEPRHAGSLANALPAYADSLGAAVLVQYRDPTTRPTLYLPEAADSLLARDQRSGINNARYHEILDVIAKR